jgi:hypothetical protein
MTARGGAEEGEFVDSLGVAVTTTSLTPWWSRSRTLTLIVAAWLDSKTRQPRQVQNRYPARLKRVTLTSPFRPAT